MANAPAVIRSPAGAQAPKRHPQERARLVIREGAQKGAVFILTGNLFTLGRDPTCEITLDDEKVSRKHLEIRWALNRYVARDLGSQNSFLHNGHKVSEASLHSSDTIVVGTTILELQQLDPTGKPLAKKGAGKKTTDPKVVRSRVIVGAGIALILIMVFSNSDERPKTFRERAKIDLSTEVENPKKPKKEDIESAIREVSPNYKDEAKDQDAEVFYRSGVRELENKNFRRALTNFDTALSINPNHDLAKVYKEIARQQFQKDIDAAKKAAIQARCALRFRESRMHYQTLLRLLEGEKDNKEYVNAEESLKLLDKIETGEVNWTPARLCGKEGG